MSTFDSDGLVVYISYELSELNRAYLARRGNVAGPQLRKSLIPSELWVLWCINRVDEPLAAYDVYLELGKLLPERGIRAVPLQTVYNICQRYRSVGFIEIKDISLGRNMSVKQLYGLTDKGQVELSRLRRELDESNTIIQGKCMRSG